MRSLFSYTFLTIFASVIIVVVVLSGVFIFGLQASIRGWNVHRDQQLQNLMLPALSRLYYRTGNLTERGVNGAIAPLLAANTYVYVTNAQARPVFLDVRGKQIPVQHLRAVRHETRKLRRRLTAPAPILDDTRVVGYLYAGTFGFRQELVNRIFIRSMSATVLGGITASLILALALALFFSRVVANQAASLSRRLVEIASGRRDVAFHVDGTRELGSIAASARQLQDQLASLEEIRKQSSQEIAHDIKTPITALKIQFEGMTEGAIRPTRRRLRLLYTEVQRIEQFVNDLRELGRMRHPGVRPEMEMMDAAVLVEDLRGSFESVGRERAVSVRASCAPAELLADPRLIHRALSNVMENAIRYAETGTEVDLDLRETAGAIVVTVSNIGYMSPSERRRGFQPYFRGRETHTVPGWGLGLSIAHRIVELHGGTIRFEQQEQRTSAVIRIPKQADTGSNLSGH